MRILPDIEAMRRSFRSMLSRRWYVFAAIALVGFALVVGITLSARGLFLGVDSLGEFPLAGHQRVLILAPHCDDETLAAGGLIQVALRNKIEVKVVIATNGDGFLFATISDFRRVYPRHQDFIRMGELRQEESLHALGRLGLASEDVIFLSYPDRGGPALWNSHWSASNPYRSPYSGASKSPYPVTYHPQANYSGEDYLADLRSILEDYRPDLIIYPHPEDAHPDHWALSNFARAALAEMEQEHPDYHPTAYAYLIHRPDFPRPKGLHPQSYLLPPPKLYALDPDWLRLDLSQADIELKEQAVMEYKSQLPLLRGLLTSFIRRNELFSDVPSAELPVLAEGNWLDPSTWRSAEGNPISPVQKDPEHDYISRDVLPGGDLVALYAARKAEDSLVVCAQMRKKVEPTLVYTLRVVAFGPEGVIHSAARSNNHLPAGWQHASINGDYVCYQVGFETLGKPRWIFVGADSEELGVSIVDQVAWQEVFLEPTRN